MSCNCWSCMVKQSVARYSRLKPLLQPMQRITGTKLSHQCRGDQFPDSGQKIDAFAGVKMIRVAAANRQKANFAMIAKRYQRNGTNFNILGAEQEGPLSITYGAAASLAGLQECFEWAEGRIFAVDLA